MDRPRFGVVGAVWLFLLLMLAVQGTPVWAGVCTGDCSETPRPGDDDEGGGGGGGGGGGSNDETDSGDDDPPPDVPKASETEALENDYTEALEDYAATEAEYRKLVEYEPPSSTAKAIDTSTQDMNTAQREARLDRESYERRESEQNEMVWGALQASYRSNRLARGTTAGDPVSVATGMFFTSETDFSYLHGDIEIAARRRYRSGQWIAGSFGELWSWPFDTRIIRGKRPRAEELESEAAELLQTVRQHIADALGEISAAVSRSIDGAHELSELEQELQGRLSSWETLLDSASGARDAAVAVVSYATVLDARHRDWSIPVRYKRLADDSQSLLENVRAWLGGTRELSHSFARADALLTELSALESEVSEMHTEARRAARLSASAETANRYARRDMDPDYAVFGGTDIITVVDELGTPVTYRITTEPVIDTTERFENGQLNHYPRGAQTMPLAGAATAGELTVRKDGSYLWRRADGRRFLYSRWGLLQHITDRNGNRVRLDYDSDYRLQTIRDDAGRTVAVQWRGDRITSLEDPEGHPVDYAYDEVGRLSSVTDAVGDRIEYGYSGTRLTEIRKPDGSERRYRYRVHHGQWKTVATVDEEGNEEHFRYYPERGYTEYQNPSGIVTRYYTDARGRTTRERYADGSETKFAYDEKDNLVSRTDERGHTWHYEYDDWGNRISEIDPLGRRRRWSYNRFAKITEETDYLGRTTHGHYDDSGNVVEVVHPDGLIERTTYTDRGKPRSVTDRTGETTRYAYDTNGYLSEVEHPDGAIERFEHDSMGRLTAGVDASGLQTRYEYRSDGLLSTMVRTASAPGGRELEQRTELRYNNRKDLVTRIGPGDTTWIFRYDRRHLLTETETPVGDTVRYIYRGDGKRISRVVDGLSKVAYSYDARGRLSQVHHLETNRRTRLDYDAAGNLSHRTDPGGAVTTYRYSPAGRITSREGPTGARRGFAYDAVGNLVRYTDEREFETRFSYDKMDRRTAVIGPEGHRTRFEYLDRERLVRITNATGVTSRVRYDSRGRVASRTDALGNRSERSYDAAGRLESYTDRNGATTRVRRDGFGRPVRSTNPEGESEHFAYDERGNLIERINPRGNRTVYERDELGRLTGITDPGGFATRFDLDAVGRRTAVTQADGTRREFQYSAEGLLLSVRDERGFVTSFSYTDAGRLGARIDPLGNTERFGWDKAGRLTSRDHGDGNKTLYSYDSAGNLIAETNPAGKTYRWQYDARGNPVVETNRLGAETNMRYDALGRLVEKTDFSGQSTSYTYDKLSRVKTVRRSDGSLRSFRYDNEGRVTSARSAAETLSFTYDSVGRLTRSGYASTGAAVNYRYDKAGNRVGLTLLPSGASLDYSYDVRGLLSSVALDGSLIAAFGYDERGRETSRRYPNSVTVETSYTPRGRVAGVVHRTATGGVVSGEAYVYDPAGRRRFRVDAKGSLTAYRYDEQNRLSKVHYPFRGRKRRWDAGHMQYHGVAGTAVFPVETRGPDGGGGLDHQSITSLSASQRDQVMDTLEHVMPQTKARFNALQTSWTERFSYDSRGNRTRVSNGWGEMTYDYDAEDRLISVGDTEYEYDADGNLTRITSPREIREFDYTPTNRVATASVHRTDGSVPGFSPGESLQANYAYDAFDRRVSRTVKSSAGSGPRAASSRARYLHDALSIDPIAELDIAEGGPAHSPATGSLAPDSHRPRQTTPSRFRRLDSERRNEERSGALGSIFVREGPALVAEIAGGYSRRRYIGPDAHGSVMARFDEEGRLASRVDYDAFGTILGNRSDRRPDAENASSDGGPLSRPSDSSVRAGYLAKLFDGTTGLYDYGYRDYDPAVGRFTTVDPIKDGANWYAYVENDPMNRLDPNGLFMTVGRGLGYNEVSDRYQTTDGRSLVDKSRIDIVRDTSSNEYYSDTMQLRAGALVLTSTAVQSEADDAGYEHQTIPTGEYTGHLLDHSWSYDDPILLENEQLDVHAGEGNLIHPNQFTGPGRIAEERSEGNHTGPWSRPYSRGCQITEGVDPFEALRDEVERLGYESRRGSTYHIDGTIKNNPDTIRVRVKNK